MTQEQSETVVEHAQTIRTGEASKRYSNSEFIAALERAQHGAVHGVVVVPWLGTKFRDGAITCFLTGDDTEHLVLLQWPAQQVADSLRDVDAETAASLEVFVAEHFDLEGSARLVQGRLLEALVSMDQSVSALGPAIAALDVPTSPPLAAAIQATENLWAGIEGKWGLLKSSEVATLLGAKTGTRSLASTLRQKDELIGVKRRNAFVYPGFQFDRKTGTVHTVIPELLAAARSIGVDDENLVFWLCSPSTYFGDDQPVDHLLTDPDLVDKFLQSETVSW